MANHYTTMDETVVRRSYSETEAGLSSASAAGTATPQQATSSELPMILIGLNGFVLTINESAARVLGLTIKQVKGQPLGKLMGGALAGLVNQHPETKAAHFIHTPNGTTLLARSGPVVGRNNQLLGYAIIFEDTISPAAHEAPPTPAPAPVETSSHAVTTLRQQIQSMHELIGMLPTFSHNKYWQNLLVEHMERLIKEMTSQVQQMDTLSA